MYKQTVKNWVKLGDVILKILEDYEKDKLIAEARGGADELAVPDHEAY